MIYLLLFIIFTQAYQRFFNIEQFKSVIFLLKNNNIEYQINEISNQTNFKVPKEIDVYINKKDFDRTGEILNNTEH
jgi:hypothetical protein